MAPLQLLFTTSILSIQLGVVQLKDVNVTSLAPSCPSDQFLCADGSKCIPKSYICDGKDDCEDKSDESGPLCMPPCASDMFACNDGSKCIQKSNLCDGDRTCKDRSHNFPSQCDNCYADHLFMCQKNGVDVCTNVKFKCDGVRHCDDLADELVSECPNCVANSSMMMDLTNLTLGQIAPTAKRRVACPARVFLVAVHNFVMEMQLAQTLGMNCCLRAIPQSTL